MSIKFESLPDSPGIYLFYNKNKELVYVGKAASLKNRVKSYFAPGKKTPRPIELMIHEVVGIKHVSTESVLEAVLLEGEYIKKYLPKYNVAWKDDKSWNYIVITKDLYPKVLTLRQHDRKQLLKAQEQQMYSHIFGPYPSFKTKETMNLLRRLFYISTCEPNAKRPCLYYQLGQCLGVCAGQISAQEYKRKVILPLITFLRGDKKNVIKKLAKQMKEEAHNKQFEEAARLRDQVGALKQIHDIALLDKSFIEDTEIKHSVLIEGYDISNLGSTHKVGSLVTFDQNGPIKSLYKKFNIKSVVGQSDVDCLAEVIERRLKHPEWTLPDIFLIDGGKPQVNRVISILNKHRLNLPVIGIAKGPKRDKNEFILGFDDRKLLLWLQKNKNLLIQVRDEAHRFAITFNRSKRKIQ